jgi:FtsZ-interacting cell division protein ZipA
MQPICECFDPNDTSPGCSDSLLPNGDFFDNGSGLFDDIEEDFFDPLIAVFVDHPDKWTTASWAWAAGLIVVFLVMLGCIFSAFWPEKDGKSPLKRNRGAAPASGSSSRGSSPNKQSSSPNKKTSPRARSESTQQRTSPKTSSAQGTKSSTSNIANSTSPTRPAASQRRSPTGISSLQAPPTNSGVARTSSTFREATTSSYRSAISPAKQSKTSPNNYHFDLSSPPKKSTKSSKNYYEQRGYSSSDIAEM